MQVQRVYLIHDWFYANESLVPAESLDGKEYPEAVYIITEEPITAIEARKILMYDTYYEAKTIMDEDEEFNAFLEKHGPEDLGKVKTRLELDMELLDDGVI